MKNLLFIIGLLLFLPSCQKDEINEGKKRNDSHSLHVQKRLIEGNFLNHKIERENLSEFDELKNVVAEAIARKIAVDQNLSIFLVDAIQNDQFGFKGEILFSDFVNLSYNDSRIGDILESQLSIVENEILATACDKLPNLVIAIPTMYKQITNLADIHSLPISINPCFRTADSNWSWPVYEFSPDGTIAINTVSKGDIQSTIPIQIKESEVLFPVNLRDYTTFFGNGLSEFFPQFEDCIDLRSDIVNFKIGEDCNNEYSFIDKIALRNYLRNNCTVPYNPPIIPTNPSEECDPDCERDCVIEKNVMEGLQCASGGTFRYMNNQPGGEEEFSLVYTFHFTTMCAPIIESVNCPFRSHQKVFVGNVGEFFTFNWYFTEIPVNNPNVIGVYFVGTGFIVQEAWPIYYDIPAGNSPSQLYTQYEYLTPGSYWNPNIFGTQISCGIYEHDAVTTKTKSERSFKVVNSVNVSSDLIPGTNKEHHPLKASWDYTVTKSSSQSVQTIAEEDVQLGTFEENYCSSNYQQGGIFGYGYSASTGQIYTHLAFYY